MNPETGRCAILFPHGVLFRNEESEMRRKLVESDLIECVLGLGPGLFYNSPMEACVIVCHAKKPKKRAGKILFIDAISDVAREQAQSFLKPEHQENIINAYRRFAAVEGYTAVVPNQDVISRDGRLSIPLYVKKPTARSNGKDVGTIAETWKVFEDEGKEFWAEMDALTDMLDDVVSEGAGDA